MFGTNPIRKFEAHPKGSLQVHEVFYTLQGEGPHSGLPAVFVRLSGCNLACFWCDTHWDDANDPIRAVHDILEEVRYKADGKTKLIVLTGGEPCRQDLSFFLLECFRLNWRVQIETAGTVWQECLDQPHVEIICSPKTGVIKPEIREKAVGFKYVINIADDPFGESSLDVDGLPSANTQIKGGRKKPLAKPRPGAPIYLSPCDLHEDKEGTEANYRAVGEIALKHGYRAGVQLHKLLNLP
jgi:7-carboxy-7-deazaguanine synthase